MIMQVSIWNPRTYDREVATCVAPQIGSASFVWRGCEDYSTTTLLESVTAKSVFWADSANTNQHTSVNTRTFPNVNTLTATDLPFRSLTSSHRSKTGAKRGSGIQYPPKYRNSLGLADSCHNPVV